MSAHGFLWMLGAFFLALGVLVVVHELGHYTAARMCNVKILRFSVGFGRTLWMRRFGCDQTEWAIAAFPLGGYVRMLDERDGEVPPEDLHRAFNRQSVGRRSFIVLAGPLANLVLAVCLYWILFVGGVDELRPILAKPPAGSLAAGANVGSGDTVRSVSGVPVATWMELRWQVLQRVLDRQEIVLETIDADSHISHRRIDTAHLPGDVLDGDVLPQLGLKPFRPELPPVIGDVQPISPATRAGIQAGDRVLSIDGRPVATWQELARTIRESEGRRLVMEIERDSRKLSVEVVPEVADDGKGGQAARIGILMRDNPALRNQMFVKVSYPPATAMQRALGQTWETAVISLRMIGRMLVGELSVKNISGPVTIADYAGQSARLGGEHYLRFLALISISLGVLNLLPIPVLDGGHLMYYLAEFIKGGPLSERVMEIGQQAGLALLAMLMALAFYNDINRLLSG